jgi:hypothetical protein
MANVLFKKFKEAAISGDIGLDSANVKCALIDTGAYTFSQTHDFLNDVAGGSIIATSGNLANKTLTDGIFDADDITISAVTGTSIEAIILYEDTGTSSTSHLVAYIDTGTGLPFTPSGGDVILSWSNSATKIFEI